MSLAEPTKPEVPKKSRAWIGWIIAGALGLGVGLGAGAARDTSTVFETVTETVTVASAPTAAQASTVPTAQPSEPGPVAAAKDRTASRDDIDETGLCDYTLEPDTFVGSIDITNNGEVDARIKATASFKQLGANPLRLTKTFTVAAGAQREVQFKSNARSNQIDLHQSANSDCAVTYKIVR